VRDDEHVVQDAPADGGVGGVEDRAGTGELDTELLEARAGDDLERVSRLVFIGVRKDFLDEIALYGGESAYQEFVVKRQLWHFGMDPNHVVAQWISWIALVRR
jgi:hypothetical protein